MSSKTRALQLVQIMTILSIEWDCLKVFNRKKAIQNNFYMDDFIKSEGTPKEAVKVFNQLQLFF